MHTRTRCGAVALVAAAVASFVGGSALAANIAGTARNDVLRGTAQADRLLGKGGNDRLYGLAGNDVLVGGPGNDLVVGGPGADALSCGAGRDTAMADARDRPAADCETIRGFPTPALAVADATAAEGNAGATVLQLSVRLAKPSPLRASVGYSTRDGSATAGSDYAPANGTLTFAPGESAKTVSVSIMGDTTFEPDETFELVLSNPVNASLGRASGTGTITNEDVQRPKGGRYSGTTSQNRPIALDVDAGATHVTSIDITVDINCTEVPVTLANERFNTALSVPVGPDFRFSYTDSYADADGSISLRLDGGLAVNGPASGTFRIDMSLNVAGSVINCSTGDVSWSASPPA